MWRKNVPLVDGPEWPKEKGHLDGEIEAHSLLTENHGELNGAFGYLQNPGRGLNGSCR